MSDNSMKAILKSVEDLYVKGNYQQGIDLLMKSKSELSEGLFHYNLGTLYLKLQQLGPARYNLEKANKLGFSNELVRNNINYIREQDSVSDIRKEKNLYDTIFHQTMEMSTYQFGSFILIPAIIALVALRLKKVSLKVFLCVFILLTIIPGLFKIYSQSNYISAVIMSDVSIFEGPSKIYEENGKIMAGSKVLIGKSHNDWFYILSPVSIAGWVKRSELGFY